MQNITYDALHDKLLTALAGGDAPDLSWGLPEWLGELSRMGALRDLTEEAKTWPDRSAIYPNVIDALTIDGHLLAMPHYLGIRALLVHEDMLKAAGIAAPPKTWDELIADCAGDQAEDRQVRLRHRRDRRTLAAGTDHVSGAERRFARRAPA